MDSSAVMQLLVNVALHQLLGMLLTKLTHEIRAVLINSVSLISCGVLS